jgi:hypothetical protein
MELVVWVSELYVQDPKGCQHRLERSGPEQKRWVLYALHD